MLPTQRLFEIGFEIQPDTSEFLGKVVIALLNALEKRNVNTNYCKFLGNNDIITTRGNDTIIFSFSRSKRMPTINLSEYPISKVTKDKNEIVLTEPTILDDEYFKDSPFKKHWNDPIHVAFPSSYLGLKDEELKNAHKKVAELLVKPTLEDVEQINRIVKVNPIFIGRNFLKQENLCFVLLPFKEPYTEIYNKIIKPVVESEGFVCLKSDDIFGTSAVIEDIWANINKASLIIAEISDNNPNVMYELGICHTIGKEVMMITQNPEKIPFNFRHLRYYSYSDEIAKADELKKNISSMIRYIKSLKK